MHREAASFDSNCVSGDVDGGFSQAPPPLEDGIQLPNLSMEDFSASSSSHQNASQEALAAAAAAMSNELQLADIEAQQQGYGGGEDPCNWDAAATAAAAAGLPQMQDFGFNNQEQHQAFNSSPELLNLFNLPRCSASPLLPVGNSSMSFASGVAAAASSAAVLYDPLLHLNLPPQPPLFRELIQSLPHGFGSVFAAGSPGTAGSLFGGMVDEGEGSGGGGHVYGHDHGDGDGDFGGQFETGVLEFARGIACNIGKGRDGAKGSKHFATEKQRREHLNDKYAALRSLVPHPTKIDRASVVGDAIDYIKELLRTVSELQLLVDKKRCCRARSKRQKTEDSTITGEIESCNNQKPFGEPVPPLRSSWLQRKSKETEVDVRIIEDEVTIKLVQRKKINCLLNVSKILDELQLDLHHVAGGLIGDYYSFLFNSKIYEGSCVYASAIANKLIESVDKQYATNAQPTTSF